MSPKYCFTNQNPASLTWLKNSEPQPIASTSRARCEVDSVPARAPTMPAAVVVATVAEWARRSLPRLDVRRIVLAALEVHDVVRDALARELPQAGAQVIVLLSSISPEQLARAAADEDADTVIVATYNGGALTLGKALMRTLPADVTVIFGGVLNVDDGGPLPVDARPGLEALGIRCVGEIEGLGAALA